MASSVLPCPHGQWTTCRYLLEPLTALEEEQQGQQQLTVVMLLDALDEASDGNAGFQPVAALIARE